MWSVREREHFFQHNFAFTTFNGQQIATPGKNGTSGQPVPSPSGAEAIVCFGNLSVHCGCHTETRYENAPYPITETHILKDVSVNLAYRM